jgi:hypothetical protein
MSESTYCLVCEIPTYTDQPYCRLHTPKGDDDWFICQDCHRQFHDDESHNCSYCNAEVCSDCWESHWEEASHAGWEDPEADLPPADKPFLEITIVEPTPAEAGQKPRLYLF